MPQYCSFCGKAEHEIFYLVAAPTALICDACVALASEVVQMLRAPAARGEPLQKEPPDSSNE